MALSTSPALKRRNWADLDDGPAGLIADRVLAYDLAGYLRFRAVCREWRRCSADPRPHSSLDRRFHPRGWILLHREELASPYRRRFLNTFTGECVTVDLPELRDHVVLAVTAEGLLVLFNRHPPRTTVRLLNPLTGHLTDLPPLTTLLSKDQHDMFFSTKYEFKFGAWGSGILGDDSTVVLSFNKMGMLGMAKPGDACWTRVRFHSFMRPSSSMFAGRFYCVTERGLMVLKNHPPRLELAAKLPMPVSELARANLQNVHLVGNAGELMLVHRSKNFSKRECDVYRVDLDAGTLCRVDSFGGGGHALFIGMHWSHSVPIGVFPTDSISGDTIYLSFDISERKDTVAYHLADKSTTPAASDSYSHKYKPAEPHTLVDCLSLCSTGRIWL